MHTLFDVALQSDCKVCLHFIQITNMEYVFSFIYHSISERPKHMCFILFRNRKGTEYKGGQLDCGVGRPSPPADCPPAGGPRPPPPPLARPLARLRPASWQADKPAAGLSPIGPIGPMKAYGLMLPAGFCFGYSHILVHLWNNELTNFPRRFRFRSPTCGFSLIVGSFSSFRSLSCYLLKIPLFSRS